MATLNTLPPKLDLVVYAGDDTRIQMDFVSGSVAYDFIGTLSAQIRELDTSTTSYAVTVTEDPVVTGRLFLVIPSETSEALIALGSMASKYIGDELVTATMWSGKWDLQIANGTDVKTLVFGNVVVVGEITK